MQLVEGISSNSKTRLTLLYRTLLQSPTAPAPSEREPSFCPIFTNKTSHKSIIVKMQSYATLYLKRKENLMSSSDDYHRHRLRTATKYFKVSVKPFQRLVGFGATSREKRLGGVCGAAAPRKNCRFDYNYSN